MPAPKKAAAVSSAPKKAAPKEAAPKKVAPKAAAAGKSATPKKGAAASAPKKPASKAAAGGAGAARDKAGGSGHAAPLKKNAVAKKAEASKAAPARAVPKVSPLAGMPLDAYIAEKAAGWHGEALRAIAGLVRAVVPEVEIAIKWGQPVFSHKGLMAFARANKGHVTFGFWRGAELRDPEGVLEGDGDLMRHVKIARLDDVRAGVLRPLVEQAAALNQAKGDPTRRG
ncbi:MAG: DUF1801 domain-containing protein [Polyangiaceae bacterium]